MNTYFIVAFLGATCGLLGGCDNTRASPAEPVTVGNPSRQTVLEPGVAPPPAIAPARLSRSDTYSEDFDADGIADSRTIQSWTFDPESHRCTQVTEIDFDADGTIDSRSTAVTTVPDSVC